MSNRLANATSPYLLQHADNPVDWYEWGEEAFAVARARDRPILLSVGYSSCHWCHVMAHESFEDHATAQVMNRSFVNVKVDREERPDVDRIYMDAVQAMTGRGGWPMTVFLTPEGRPFYAGTYFPEEDRGGLPSFRRVMAAVSDAWEQRRDQVEQQARQLTEAISRSLPPADETPGTDILPTAYRAVAAAFDPHHGGFGGAPKFPQAPTLEFLLRIAGAEFAPEATSMLTATLEAMAAGGIYDQLGGGFARYAVDAQWLVPHFEKMLYDNALLARLYLRAWQLTGAEDLRRVAVETIEYMLRDLALPDGGLASAEDADSEGEEGRFYVWSRDEFWAAAGPADGPAAALRFGVTDEGNFEGANVLRTARPIDEVAGELGLAPAAARAAVDRAKAALLHHRNRRVRPGLDDKVVTAWNGLALRAFAEAGAVLGNHRYLEAARANARFILEALRRKDGRLLRSWRDGAGGVAGFCEDYASYALGLLALYQATGELAWFDHARTLVDDMVALFADPAGGFFSTGVDVPALVARPKDVADNPTPSANAMAAEVLLHLAHYDTAPWAREMLEGTLAGTGRLMESHPSAAGHILAVLHTMTADPKEVVVVGTPGSEDTEALRRVIWERFRPDVFLALDDGDGGAASRLPILEGRTPHRGPALAYVCRQFACEVPTGDPRDLRRRLDAVETHPGP